MAEKVFADGLMFKRRDNAPDYVIGSLSIKAEEFKKFLDEHVSNAGWVNVDILTSKGGKPYCALNTYKPEKPDVVKEEAAIEYPDAEIKPDDIPF